MKKFKIKPDSGHPYINIRLDAIHQESSQPLDGRKGDMLLNVLHNNGTRTDLAFYNYQIEEVK